jgi:hypothetical protein
MKKLVFGLIVSLILTASVSRAQEQGDEAEPRPEPRRRIRVLEDPYQISSFYRSSQEPVAPLYFGEAPLTNRRSMTDRYPIAGYYRQGGGQGQYSRFWSQSGGTRPRAYGFRGSRRVGASELCLLAPTLLGPVAPLTDSGR